MKTLRRLGMFLIAALAFALAVPSFAVAKVVHTFRAAKTLVLDGIEHVLSHFKQEKRADLNPVVMLVQACAYATRLAKRERPNMTPGWRMCPSA